MKRWLIAIMLFIPAITFIGCGDGDNDPLTEVPEKPDNGNDDDEHYSDWACDFLSFAI